METIVGMTAILVGIFGVVVSLGGIIGIFVTLPDAIRVWRTFGREPTEIRRIREGTVTIRGEVEPDPDGAFPSYGASGPLVMRRVQVHEHMGKRSNNPLDVVEGGRFSIRDGSGERAIVVAEAGAVLSGEMAGGGALPPELAYVPLEWGGTNCFWVEQGVPVGRTVTVNGSAQREGGQVVIRHPRVAVNAQSAWATEEVRFFAYAIAAIPGGMLISAVSWLVLQWTL